MILQERLRVFEEHLFLKFKNIGIHLINYSETSFMTQLIGKDIAFYKSNGERINSDSCKITY